jgi:two-component system cell cycle response regulator CtrA
MSSFARLEKKLMNASGGQDYIETIWGRGYTLREPTKQAIRKLTQQVQS